MTDRDQGQQMHMIKISPWQQQQGQQGQGQGQQQQQQQTHILSPLEQGTKKHRTWGFEACCVNKSGLVWSGDQEFYVNSPPAPCSVIVTRL